MIQFLPLIIEGLIGAGMGAATNALTAKDTKIQTPAQTGGGSAAPNPIADFFGQYERPNASVGPPKPVDTGALAQGKMTPPTNVPTTELEPIDMESLPKRRKTQEESQQLGDLLASIPEALATAMPLLGFGEDNRQVPVPGSGYTTQNPYAQAFGPLPKPPTLGELLSSLPRMR